LRGPFSFDSIGVLAIVSTTTADEGDKADVEPDVVILVCNAKKA